MPERKVVGFQYTIEVLDKFGEVKSSETVHNLMPTAALNYILGAAFNGVSPFTNWYMGLYGANRAPIASDTMTTLMADCAEDVSYSETTRPQVVFAAAADGTITNAANSNTFSFTSNATVRGIFITTSPTKGSNTGLLISAVLQSTAKTPEAGETIRAEGGFTFASV